MQALNQFALFLAASFLLTGCGEAASPQSGSSSGTASSVAASGNTSGSAETASSEVVVEEDAPSDETTNESGSFTEGGTTQLNEAEAGIIERGKARVAELTGYPEGEQYLYFIGEVQGSVVTIEIRENGEQAASALGFYRYDDATGAVQQMDITTGEYVDLPANP